MSRRVLCCSGSLEGGGSERQLWQLATGIDPQRLQTEIYLLYRRGDYLSRIPAHIPVHDFWSEQVPSHWRYPGQIRGQQIQQLTRIIRQRKIDCVYDRTFHMTLLTASACRQTATPRVSVIVSPPSQDFVRSRERFGWLKKRLLAAAYRDPLCRPVAVSAAVADDAALFYGVPRERFETIPSPIDIAAVRQAAQEVLPEGDAPAAPDQRFQISVVGRLSAEKGQTLAIAAVAQLKVERPELAVQLNIIGDGPDRQALQQQVEQLGLQASVHFTGRLANPYPWIRASDLICIPSYYEGLPNVALEAMCLETPLLATDCSGALRELLGNRERGVVVPIETAALTAGMRDRLDSPDQWQGRTLAAAAWVQAQHGLGPWLERMQVLLEQQIEARNLA